ncbi:hypothetical protein LZ30DRAFT_331312 [Colletotrichum cereale]|nr:hypothetical protein LZ30DRAFT_331312 [Colletotrichum cereale]
MVILCLAESPAHVDRGYPTPSDSSMPTEDPVVRRRDGSEKPSDNSTNPPIHRGPFSDCCTVYGATSLPVNSPRLPIEWMTV